MKNANNIFLQLLQTNKQNDHVKQKLLRGHIISEGSLKTGCNDAENVALITGINDILNIQTFLVKYNKI